MTEDEKELLKKVKKHLGLKTIQEIGELLGNTKYAINNWYGRGISKKDKQILQLLLENPASNQVNLGNNNHNVFNKEIVENISTSTSIEFSERIFKIAQDLEQYGNKKLLDEIENKLSKLKGI